MAVNNLALDRVRNDVLEEAARICEAMMDDRPDEPIYRTAARDCAEAIRQGKRSAE